VQVFGLDFLLSEDLNAIKVSQLRNVEQNLQTVKFAVLHGVAGKVYIGE